jgi:hypothetical protein
MLLHTTSRFLDQIGGAWREREKEEEKADGPVVVVSPCPPSVQQKRRRAAIAAAMQLPTRDQKKREDHVDI